MSTTLIQSILSALEDDLKQVGTCCGKNYTACTALSLQQGGP
jgi:hypothetical protein